MKTLFSIFNRGVFIFLLVSPAAADVSNTVWLEQDSEARLQWVREQNKKTNTYLRDDDQLFQSFIERFKIDDSQDDIFTVERAGIALERKLSINYYNMVKSFKITNSQTSRNFTLSDFVSDQMGSTLFYSVEFSTSGKYVEVLLARSGAITHYEYFLINTESLKIDLHLKNVEMNVNLVELKSIVLYTQKIGTESFVKEHNLGEPVEQDKVTSKETSSGSYYWPSISQTHRLLEENDVITYLYSTNKVFQNGVVAVVKRKSNESVQELRPDDLIIVPERANAVMDDLVILDQEKFAVIYHWGVESWVEVFSVKGEALQRISMPAGIFISDVQLNGASSLDIYFFNIANNERQLTFDLAQKSFVRDGKKVDFFSEESRLSTIVHPDTQKQISVKVVNLSSPSHDGVAVPSYAVYAPELARLGEIPVYMSVYGGFAKPFAGPQGLGGQLRRFISEGGMVVFAGVRGGYEYGEKWHAGGALKNKRNSGLDLVAVAEDLVRIGYTKPSRIAITGTSNGGLVVGMAVTQKPEAFGLALPINGVMDVLQKDILDPIYFGWSYEYGQTSNEDYVTIQKEYSPVENATPRVYPPVLTFCGLDDDRVNPIHSLKWTQALQSAQQGNAPILMYSINNGGHGLSSQPNIDTAYRARFWTMIYKTIVYQ